MLEFLVMIHSNLQYLSLRCTICNLVKVFYYFFFIFFLSALSRRKTPVKVQPKTYPIMFYDPPVLPKDNSLIGIPVYVNFDAIIYVQEVKSGQSKKIWNVLYM